MKMHLAARVPNEGARKLAWWIGRECSGRVQTAAVKLRMAAGVVERLLAGELVPGEELIRPLCERTCFAVEARDWRRSPIGGWFDSPPPLAREA